MQAFGGVYELVVFHHVGWHLHELTRVTVECPSTCLEIPIGDRVGVLTGSLPPDLPDETLLTLRLLPGAPRHAPEWSLGTAMTCERVPLEHGVFRTPPLPVGTYDVEISLGDHGAARVTGVTVAAGRETSLGALELDGADLAGRVHDADGRPAAQARVILVAPGMDQLGGGEVRRERRVDADGSYRLQMLDARRWTAYAVGDDGSASAVERVDLFAGEARTLDFALRPACFVRGRVTRAGQPAPGIRVRWRHGGFTDLQLSLGAPGSVFTGEDGAFALGPFLAGDYGVMVDGDRLVSLDVRLSPGEDALRDVELELPTADVTLTLDGRSVGHVYTITTRALDPESRFAGQRIYAQALGPGRVALPRLSGPQLVLLSFRQGGEDPSLLAVVNGERLRDGDAIPLANGKLELAAPAGRIAGQRPKLYVVSLPEGDLGSLSEWTFLPSEQAGDRLLFSGVPPGARLRFDAGPGREHELTADASGAMRLDWPFGDQ